MAVYLTSNFLIQFSFELATLLKDDFSSHYYNPFIVLGMVSEAVGVLVAVVVQGQLVSKTRKIGSCNDDDKPSKEQLDDEVRSIHRILRNFYFAKFYKRKQFSSLFVCFPE